MTCDIKWLSEERAPFLQRMAASRKAVQQRNHKKRREKRAAKRAAMSPSLREAVAEDNAVN
jgi:hypothetical protein